MTLYLLKVHLQTFLSIPVTQKCQILSCDTLVTNELYDITLLYVRALVYSYVVPFRQVTVTRTEVVSAIIVNHCSSEALRIARWRQYIWREISTLAALCCEINLA